MRTTIQLPEEHKKKLLELAARRGQRGCSRVVEEAVARYLEDLERPMVPAVATREASPPLAPADHLRALFAWAWSFAPARVDGAVQHLRARFGRFAV